jgi:hypothetical protein
MTLAFTGCGKTPPGHQIRQLCNKGTASAGPQVHEKKRWGFSPS